MSSVAWRSTWLVRAAAGSGAAPAATATAGAARATGGGGSGGGNSSASARPHQVIMHKPYSTPLFKPPVITKTLPPYEATRKKSIGVILFRKAVVVPEAHSFEKAYKEWKWQLDKEAAEPVIMEFWSKSSQTKEMNAEEEERMKEEQLVKPYPRITNADRTNDQHSIKRKLDKPLYFVVRPKNSDRYFFPEWEPPKDRIDFVKYNEEKMIQWYRPPTGFRFFFPGFHPSAVHVASEKETYFFLATLMSGHPTITSAPGHQDHLWLTKRELAGVLSKAYYNSVKEALFDY